MPSPDTQSGAAPPRLSPRPLGRTGLEVAPLGLASLSIPAFGRRAAGLTADDVERAFHERGVNTFLAHYLSWRPTISTSGSSAGFASAGT
jgi:hypothetical protein